MLGGSFIEGGVQVVNYFNVDGEDSCRSRYLLLVGREFLPQSKVDFSLSIFFVGCCPP